MRVRLPLAISACLLLQAQPAADDVFARRLTAFHRHYGPLFLDFFGCPEGAKVIEECKPKLGRLNYQEYKAARKAAIELFQLEEKR